MQGSAPAAPLCALGVVAIECSHPAIAASPLVLTQAQAGMLGELLAADLARLLPESTELDLVLCAALYDPIELLRPGFPLHAALDRLAAAAPGRDGGRVIAFGAGPDGLPTALAAQPELGGGPLAVLPFLLRGPTARVAVADQAMEQRLLDTGMVGAATALAARRLFDLGIEHMRLLSLHDLLAMMAMQYQHAGLAAIWPMIEAALFGDGGEILLDSAPEPLLRYADGKVRIALFDADAWALVGHAPSATSAEHLEWLFGHYQARQRQIAAVLAGHGIEVTYDHCPAGQDARAILRG